MENSVALKDKIFYFLCLLPGSGEAGQKKKWDQTGAVGMNTKSLLSLCSSRSLSLICSPFLFSLHVSFFHSSFSFLLYSHLSFSFSLSHPLLSSSRILYILFFRSFSLILCPLPRFFSSLIPCLCHCTPHSLNAPRFLSPYLSLGLHLSLFFSLHPSLSHSLHLILLLSSRSPFRPSSFSLHTTLVSLLIFLVLS